MKNSYLKYVAAYSLDIQNKVQQMIEQKTLSNYLLSKYPTCHDVVNEKSLRIYVNDLKNRYIKKSSPLSKIKYDDKIHVVNNALGLHTFISRVQGNKLKSKNELRIATMFKTAPEEFLEMIIVHELA